MSLSLVNYDNEFEMKEIKFKPRLKLKHKEIRMYIWFISIQVKV